MKTAGLFKPTGISNCAKSAKILYVRGEDLPASYASAIKEKFGVEIQPQDERQLEETCHSIDEDDVRAEAVEFIKHAERVMEASEQDIMDACRMYLAIKKLVDEESAQGMAIRCLDLIAEGLLSVYPCLAWSRFDD